MPRDDEEDLYWPTASYLSKLANDVIDQKELLVQAGDKLVEAILKHGDFADGTRVAFQGVASRDASLGSTIERL